MKIIMVIKGKKIQIKVFDIAVIFIFIFVVVSLFFVLFRKQSKINIVITVNEESLAYQTGGVPNWYAQFLHVGMKKVDVFGRSIAEIKGIRSYHLSNQKSVVHLMITLNAVYSLSNRIYTYDGKNVLVGSTIEIPFDNLLVKGLIIDTDDLNKTKLKKILAKAQIRELDTTFPQTEGVPSYIAESIQQGDIMKDSLGNPVIKIVKKTVEDAKMTVVTSNGDVILQKHPMRKDVFLDLEIWGEKIDDRYYLFGDINFPILVNNSIIFLNNNNGTAQGLPFYVRDSLIWLTVTKIDDIQ